jgi:hypothetical protein
MVCLSPSDRQPLHDFCLGSRQDREQSGREPGSVNGCGDGCLVLGLVAVLVGCWRVHIAVTEVSVTMRPTRPIQRFAASHKEAVRVNLR